jgi:branched-chain amino acid transport system substrate-binding protein
MKARPALVAAAAALVVTLPAARAASPRAAAAEPGVTATRVLLGATAPLSGPDAAASAVARGAEAYFRFVDARGGVHGRRIDYVLAEDGSDPDGALEATRELVEGDRVFAIVNPWGTEQGLAARDYLNATRVPQLFVASAATTFGRDAARYPWTIGFGPSDRAQGWILGRSLARLKPGSRVGVLSDGGEEARELAAGLRLGIAASTVRIVATHSVDVARLRAAGANVLALFVPAAAATEAAAHAARLGWRPLVLTTTGATAPGALSPAFVKDPAEPRWAGDPGVRLYRTIMARYAPGASARDLQHMYGMAVAYATVEVLQRAGRNLTRAGLLARARTLNSVSNPFLLPGIQVRTGPGDGFPIEQAQLRRWRDGAWRSFGGLWRSGA